MMSTAMLILHFFRTLVSSAAIHEEAMGGRLDVRYAVSLLLIFIHQCQAQCYTSGSALLNATKTPQTLYSVDYPDTYPNDVMCSWVITSPIETGRIQLTILNSDFHCCCGEDRLTIYDGINSTGRGIAILCSEQNPVTITSSGSALYGEFVSNADGSAKGYSIEYSYFDSRDTCPPQWVRHSSYCYQLYTDATSWFEAASRCGYDGGFLSSIASPEENAFLIANFKNQTSEVWIGLNGSSIDRWIDGTNISYENFQKGRPTYGLCARLIVSNNDMSNGEWEVVDCAALSSFICKKSIDGSSGRYWTPIDPLNDSKGGFSSFVTPVVCLFIFVMFAFFCRDRRSRDDGRCLGGLCDCIIGVVAGISRGISDIYRGIKAALCACRCGSCRGVDEQANVNEVEISSGHRPPPSNSSADQSSSGISDGSRENDSPPSYGEATAEAPPPSYTEALDPTFTPSITVSTSDLRPGQHYQTDDDLQPAPSYESVVNENYESTLNENYAATNV